MSVAISVIIPFHNETEELLHCLNALQGQTFQDFEILLVPDGASVYALEIAKSCTAKNVTVLENTEAKGQSFARQRAIDIAKGQFIAIQDADDISLPKRFERQMELFKNKPTLDILGSAAQIMEKGHDWDVYQSHEHIAQQCLFNNPMIHSSALIRREVFQSYSYNSKYDTAEDYDFFSLAIQHFRFENLPDPLIQYKLPADNKSSALSQRMKARIIRERNNQYIPEVLMHSFHHFCELSNSIESGELQALATVFKSTKAAPMFNDQMMRYALKYKPKWNALQKQKAWQKAILMRKALVLKRVLFS